MEHVGGRKAEHLPRPGICVDVPEGAVQSHIGGHVVGLQGDELHRVPRPVVPVDPGIGVAPQVQIDLHQPLIVESGHGLIGPSPQHPGQPVVPQALLGGLPHEIDRQGRDGAAAHLHAPVHRGQLHGPIPAQADVLHIQKAVRPVDGGGRQHAAQSGAGAACRLTNTAQDAHLSSPPPMTPRMPPMTASTPPVIHPAGG